MKDFNLIEHVLDEVDKKIIFEFDKGIEIVSRPFLELANKSDVPESEIVERLNNFKKLGFIRKFSGAINHYSIGYTFNAMTVWDVDPTQLEMVANNFKKRGFVSHCYERPRIEGVWEYNLFAMVHGKTKLEVEEKIELLKIDNEKSIQAMDRIYSTRILKKTGIRFNRGKNV